MLRERQLRGGGGGVEHLAEGLDQVVLVEEVVSEYQDVPNVPVPTDSQQQHLLLLRDTSKNDVIAYYPEELPDLDRLLHT